MTCLTVRSVRFLLTLSTFMWNSTKSHNVQAKIACLNFYAMEKRKRNYLVGAVSLNSEVASWHITDHLCTSCHASWPRHSKDLQVKWWPNLTQLPSQRTKILQNIVKSGSGSRNIKKCSRYGSVCLWDLCQIYSVCHCQRYWTEEKNRHKLIITVCTLLSL